MPACENYRRWRAPQKNGGQLLDPAWPQLLGAVAANRSQLSSAHVLICGQPLVELASDSRRDLIRRARAYTCSYGNLPERIDHLSEKIVNNEAFPPIVLAGHQPELFHPGVWYKNFTLSRLAKQSNSIAINLIVDSDLCRQVSIGVPTGHVDQPQLEPVAFDSAADSALPYEERTILDRELFASFGLRVAKTIKPFVPEPMIKSLWPMVVQRSQQEPNLGRCLAQGRHLCEARFARQAALPTTLEVPLSEVCQLSAFHIFVVHMLDQADEFAAAHNGALANYRKAHRLRNRAHPVPDLSRDADWIETPFWIWSAADPIRRPLYVRTLKSETLISDRHNRQVSLPDNLTANWQQAVEILDKLELGQVKLRTRALCTTLFARMFLGDLFVHGIGGGKYDEVTDQIVHRFFGMRPPAYAVASATLRLPIEHVSVADDALTQIDREMRNLTYHPERFLQQLGADKPEEMSTGRRLAQEKKQWVDTAKSPANAKTRHNAITSANQKLGTLLIDKHLLLQRQRKRAQLQMRANTILDSREHPFCLFPEETLQSLPLDSDVANP